MSHLKETFIFKDLYNIRWTRLGNSSEPNITFTHGTPSNSLIWLPFARALSKDYCVYFWDLAGFGQSNEFLKDVEDVDISWALHGEVFAALCAHWSFGSKNRPHVITHDIGGHTVLRANVIHGVKYASLLLLDAVSVAPWGTAFLQSVKAHPDVFLSFSPEVFRNGPRICTKRCRQTAAGAQDARIRPCRAGPWRKRQEGLHTAPNTAKNKYVLSCTVQYIDCCALYNICT